MEEFSRDFSLRRKGESGLSLIVPFPDKDISPSEIIRAAVIQYFFPILSGDLAVTITAGLNEYNLDAGSIFQVVSESNWPDKDTVRRRLELAKWCLSLMHGNYIQIKEPKTDQAPRWEESLFESEHLNQLRKRFDEGERIALLVPLWVKKVDEGIQHSTYKVVLERDGTLERGEDFFIRDGVTITGISTLRQKGIRVIVAVSDKPLSKMLGDSENPAHTEWQERSPKFKGRFDKGVSCLRYVKNSPREIVKIISQPAEGKDVKLLSDLFTLIFRECTNPREPLRCRVKSLEPMRGKSRSRK